MIITNKNYFQKSKIFLYPLLNFKKGIPNIPIDTFVSWENRIDFDRLNFICLYKIRKKFSFKTFETHYLKGHNLFTDVVYMDGYALYIFDYRIYKNDFNNFLNGNYSKFSLTSKQKILNFFSKVSASDNIKSFLYPEEYHELYAKSLGVDIDTIKQTYELCSKPNLELETFSDRRFILDQDKNLTYKKIDYEYR